MTIILENLTVDQIQVENKKTNLGLGVEPSALKHGEFQFTKIFQN